MSVCLFFNDFFGGGYFHTAFLCAVDLPDSFRNVLVDTTWNPSSDSWIPCRKTHFCAFQNYFQHCLNQPIMHDKKSNIYCWWCFPNSKISTIFGWKTTLNDFVFTFQSNEKSHQIVSITHTSYKSILNWTKFTISKNSVNTIKIKIIHSCKYTQLNTSSNHTKKKEHNICIITLIHNASINKPISR